MSLLLHEADALGLTGPDGADLALRSTDPIDHLLLRARVDGAMAVREQMRAADARAVADAVADLFT